MLPESLLVSQLTHPRKVCVLSLLPARPPGSLQLAVATEGQRNCQVALAHWDLAHKCRPHRGGRDHIPHPRAPTTWLRAFRRA